MQLRLPACLVAITISCLLGGVCDVANAQQSTESPQVEPAFNEQQLAFFEREIRPLLVQHCWKCHGDNKQQGGLRLDSREAILTGGDLGNAATPGEPANSLLVEVIGYAGDLKMPPSGKLSDREIAALSRWVAEGLAWPPADTPPGPVDAAATEPSPKPLPWSFQPVVDPPLPTVQQSDWCQSPIDRFVKARLEAAGLQPAPPADKRTLIRRAKYDLLGLPPTAAEIDAFVADEAPDAFARLIDRLLDSPEYGQRWGRHWLDVARYADSNGQDENLAYVNAYRYRDYVVDAFNNDKPYDEFVREQIAGDLLPIATSDSGGTESEEPRHFERLIATGFLTLGPKMLAEDDPVKMEMDIVDEQLDSLGGTFLGLTLGCARCHDHKFDPISAADYYALAGIFKSTRTMDNFKVVAQWHERPLATAAEVARLAEYRAQVDAKKSELKTVRSQADRGLVTTAQRRLGDYLLAATELVESPALVSLLHDPAAAITPNLPADTVLREAENFDRGNVLVDTAGYGAGIGIILNRGELPNYVEYDLEIPRAGWYQVELRYAAAETRSVQLLIDSQLRKSEAAAGTTGSWNPDTQRWSPEGVFELPAGKVVLRLERTSGPFPHFDRLALVPRELDPGNAPALPRSAEQLAGERGLVAPFLTQWAEYLRRMQSAPESIWQPWFAYRKSAEVAATEFQGVAAGVAARLWNESSPDSSAELAARYQSAIEAAVAATASSVPDKPADPVDAALAAIVDDPQGPLRVLAKGESFYASTERDEVARLTAAVAELERAAPPAPPQAMAVEDGTATDLQIHIRGSHLSLGETVPRGFPHALASSAEPLPNTASGRLELATWMTDPAHPLTSRVLVNRLWRWHFGAGLVRSTDNFGNLGDRPSHPELLDWLAARFVESGWSIKAMHRQIMLSATYQMSTAFAAEAAEADPDNRLLWRMNRRRLEAEAVRDALLFVAGNLDPARGGSLLHSKPREYVAGTASVNATNYQTNRRSLYLPVVRSALYEPFQAFDFAEPTTIKGDRDNTTIALQALFMMNSDLMAEQSQALAERLIAAHPNEIEQRVADLYLCTLGRPADERETQRAIDFLHRAATTNTFATPGERDQSAWQALCRVLLSSNEFLYVE